MSSFAIEPYLHFPGTCAAAIAFYQEALGAELVFQQTYGGSPMASMGPAEWILHATLRIGESTMMMCDTTQPAGESGSPGISLSIGLKDPDRAGELFTKLADGGAVTMPLARTFWAAAFGMVTDRFGIRWMVNAEGESAT